MRKIAQRTVIIVVLLACSWTAMTVCHELGHLVGGWLGGATLVQADIAPWRLPYSLHQPDPRPLLTLWSGPLLGIAIPMAIALLIRRDWSWFIADFCLLANGTYLALAWVSKDQLLDTRRLLSAGASPLTIAAFCVLAIGLGYVRFRRDCIAILSNLPAYRAQRRTAGSHYPDGPLNFPDEARSQINAASGQINAAPSQINAAPGRMEGTSGPRTDARENGDGEADLAND